MLTEQGYVGTVADSFLALILALIDGTPLPGTGSGPGTGVGGPNPSDRGPVSTTGEEFDVTVFGEDFSLDVLLEFLDLTFFGDEGEGGGGDECDFGYGEYFYEDPCRL